MAGYDNSKYYIMTRKEFKECLKETIEECKRSADKEKKEVADRNLMVTRRKLKSYKRIKATLNEEEEFTEDEKIELRWLFVKDLMGSGLEYVEKAEKRISEFELKRKRNMFEVQAIENALRFYEKEAEESANEEFSRRYRVLKKMYIDSPENTIEQIAKEENVSEKTIYRDLKIACEIMSVYLLGM